MSKLKQPTSTFSNCFLAGTEFTLCYLFPFVTVTFFEIKTLKLWLSEKAVNGLHHQDWGGTLALIPGSWSKSCLRHLNSYRFRTRELEFSATHFPSQQQSDHRPGQKLWKNALNVGLQYRLKLRRKKIVFKKFRSSKNIVVQKEKSLCLQLLYSRQR